MQPISVPISLLTLMLLASRAPHDAIATGHFDFGYNEQHGPAHWAEDFHTCFGKHQSPINIEEHDVENVSLPLLQFRGLDLPRPFLLKNNGHTALIHSSKKSEPAYMTGGPLNGTYIFEQLHFHWGENDREGSEDLINNHSFAMELHAVFYKEQYNSVDNAYQYSDGLAVLAFFFETEASNQENLMFGPIVEALPKIETVGNEIQLSDDLRLEHLLNPTAPPQERMQNYFTYNGSLTTPPCSEIVTWIDFKDPVYLSHAQVAAFRNIKSSEGTKLTHNFRPVQPLSDRRVLHNMLRDELHRSLADQSVSNGPQELSSPSSSSARRPSWLALLASLPWLLASQRSSHHGLETR